MLPDLRVVTIAVISTFLFTVSVGFYTSSRLMSERKPRTDSFAAIEDHPLNRIALNWPEPVQPPSEPLNLDFAVTAKAQRDPVREVRDEPANVGQKVAAAPQRETIKNSRAEPPVIVAPKIEVSKIEAPKIEAAKVEAPKVEAPKLELPKVEALQVPPAKIEGPTVEAVASPPLTMAPQANTQVKPQTRSEDDLPTASIPESPALNRAGDEPKRQPEPVISPPASNVVNLPEAVKSDTDVKVEIAAEPEVDAAEAKPVKKKVRKAKKKAKKVVKPVLRARPRPAVTSAANPFGFPFNGFQSQGSQPQRLQTQGFQAR